ncbi:MAG: hypothetical protein E6Q97_13435 [Desulfurellales bacterium]|nr:MAG: hypothetical protein E6Q97_13435 [Desulfurellales bacterium]
MVGLVDDYRKNAALAEVLGCINAIANAGSTVLADTLWLNHSTTVVDSLVAAAILLDATDEQIKEALGRKQEERKR